MIWKPLVVAIFFSLLLNIVFALTISESIHFVDGKNPEEFYSLSYEDQVEWKKENMITVKGFKYLKETLSHSSTSIPFLLNIIWVFFILFFSCLITALWVNKKNDS